MLRHLTVALLLVSPLRAQTSSGILVEVAGITTNLSDTALLSLPQDTVRARARNGPEQVFAGPSLRAVLTRAGAHLDSLRGPALAQYVLVDARDDYRVVLAIAELVSDFTPRRV